MNRKAYVFLGVMAIAVGCSHPGTPHLPALTAAADSVSMGMTELAQWSPDSLVALRNRVDERMKDLSWLMEDSLMDFSLDEAQLIGDWTRVRRFVKDAPERLNQLKAEGQRCQQQLEGLAQAIREGAEVDAQGTAMDEAYVERETQRELLAVRAWQSMLEDTQRMASAGTQLEGETRAAIDSLIVAKRAIWAQRIAGSE